MSNNISQLRSMESSYLKAGKLTAADASKLVAKAKTAEDKAALREMFTHDAFESDAARAKALKAVGVKPKDAAVAVSPMAGKPVGNTTVVRTFGPAEGYSNKFQALATARLQGADPLAVVKDSNGKWHAAQTKEKLTTRDISTAFPLAQLPQPPAKNTAYQTALALPEGTDEQKAAKAKALAVAALGIPEDLVTAGKGWSRFDPEKINVDTGMTTASGRTHIHDGKCGCGHKGASVELSLSRLKDGTNFISGTLFHEGQHKSDDDVLHGQLEQPGKLTSAEKRTVADLKGAQTSKESSAYARAFLATVDQDKEVALNQLLGFLDNEINNAATPNQLNPTLRADLVKEMKAHYETLPPDLQEQFKQVVAVAELRHPKSTLYTELFGSAPKPAVTVDTIKTDPAKKAE